MLIRRKQSSIGSTGLGGIGSSNKTTFVKKGTLVKKPITSSSSSVSSCRLYQPAPSNIVVQRVPFFSMGGMATVYEKKFQRPSVKRRAYGKQQDVALRQSTLGQKRRTDGMQRLLERAGRGLNYIPTNRAKVDGNIDGSDDDESDKENEPERPYEPLEVWTSPHQGGTPKGLPPQMVREMRLDEFGIEEEVTVLKPASIDLYRKTSVFVPQPAATWLRPHQREGVKFMYECVMGLRDFRGNGCILADDMGLGKTLQSVSLIYTLLNTGITADGAPSAKRIIVVCPCSLVNNWFNEFEKWLGKGVVKAVALSDKDRKGVESEIDSFCKTRIIKVLIASYECIRMHVERFRKYKDCCDLLVCDEAHRLKNSDSQTSQALNSLPVKRRVLLTGTPMQNDLQEFYAMVDFTNPGILGTPEEFRRRILFPVLRGREPDATEAQKKKMMEIQNDMSSTVNDFILRRVNTLNAEHLPPKLVQVVSCNLTEIQKNMYQHLINSKDTQHMLDGKQANCLASIQLLMKLCNHPSLVAEDDRIFGKPGSVANNEKNRRSTAKVVKYNDDPSKETLAVPGADGISRFMPCGSSGGSGGRGGNFDPVHPEWSGKMFVLYRLMKEMRKPGNGNDKIVIISNYTQTLDLIGRMCRENSWGFCRLDGSVTMKKRTKMVDEFNDPTTSLVAFLLSSKAGGCGLNLIGGNRLVLFDPDWNPAVDKQAAARCWRDGQRKRCFTYRFLATGTVEEKIFQRQLSKEGLQSIVDDKEQVNALSTKDLRNLFKLRHGTPSDTHDKLRCERCKIIHDTAEIEAKKSLPRKLARCRQLLDVISGEDDARYFLQTLDPAVHGRTKEEYEKLVKQPMDFAAIKNKLDLPPEQALAYKSVTGFSKDVNRVFGNVMKVWSPGEDIADAARRLQAVWIEQWTDLVPALMAMKSCDDEETFGKEPQDLDDLDDLLKNCATVNNERGDDYQEQIGMPDEENMRHWSHHYSSDTVDDPIFRAAMRGCDAVSFVFGLEVTWSLIQQRQQDEEERLAMEALECIQEADEETMNDDEDCEVEGKDSVDVAGSNEDLNMVSSGSKESLAGENEDDEDSEQDDDGIVDEPMMQDESGNDEDTDNDNSKEEDDGETLSTMEVVSDQEEDDVLDSLGGCGKHTVKEKRSSTSTDVESSDHLDSPSSTNESVSDPNQWSCYACTYLNAKSSRKCAVCGAKKPQERTSSSVKESRRCSR